MAKKRKHDTVIRREKAGSRKWRARCRCGYRGELMVKSSAWTDAERHGGNRSTSWVEEQLGAMMRRMASAGVALVANPAGAIHDWRAVMAEFVELHNSVFIDPTPSKKAMAYGKKVAARLNEPQEADKDCG